MEISTVQITGGKQEMSPSRFPSPRLEPKTQPPAAWTRITGKSPEQYKGWPCAAHQALALTTSPSRLETMTGTTFWKTNASEMTGKVPGIADQLAFWS